MPNFEDGLVTPKCCAAIQESKAVRLYHDDYELVEDGDKLSPPKWMIEGLQKDSRGHYDRSFRTVCEAFFCPFCGTKLPEVQKKAEPPKDKVCVITDGGYYCDTCSKRGNECDCLPQVALWEPKQ